MMKRPQVLLIHTPCPYIEDDMLEPPMGILSIAGVLLNKKIPVSVLDFSGMPIEECKSILKKHKPVPEIVGFSTYSVNYHITKQLLEELKNLYPNVTTVAGGPHASALPDEVKKDFNFVIVGEGEEVFLNLVLEKTKKSIIHASPIKNIDSLPFPAYELIDVNRYTRKVNGMKSLSVLTNRGCLFSCNFCNSRVVKRGASFFRVRSPESVVSEVKMLNEKYGIKSIRFQDDLFTVSPKRIESIFKLIPWKVTYRCFARADTLTKEMCKILADTGCKHIAVGVESGSSEILKRMNKGLTPDKIREGLTNARDAGLRIRIYLIVGFPGETDETINETMNFLKNIPFDEFTVYPCIPYPGTPLYEKPDKFGITWIDPDFSKYVQVGVNRITGYVLRTKNYEPKKVKEWHDKVIDYIENELGMKWVNFDPNYR